MMKRGEFIILGLVLTLFVFNSCTVKYNLVKIGEVKEESSLLVPAKKKKKEIRQIKSELEEGVMEPKKGTKVMLIPSKGSYQIGEKNCKYRKVRLKDELAMKKYNFGRKSIKGLWVTEKAVALTALPKDKLNHYVDWVAAAKDGVISPRGSLSSNEIIDPDMFNEDVLIKVKSPLRNNICFPHSVHTFWLGCDNCHVEIFSKKRGANPINMTKIIKGEYCGRCHGKVAFHVANNCFRCHNTPKKKTD